MKISLASLKLPQNDADSMEEDVLSYQIYFRLGQSYIMYSKSSVNQIRLSLQRVLAHAHKDPLPQNSRQSHVNYTMKTSEFIITACSRCKWRYALDIRFYTQEQVYEQLSKPHRTCSELPYIEPRH